MSQRSDRRRVLPGSALVVACLAAGLSATAAEADVSVTTFTYKTVDGHDIKADLHRADDDKLRPLVVWIHGGALINGNRAGVSGRIKGKLLDEGYAILSIDYRLAPETKLPAIIEDLEDAFAWIDKNGKKLLRVDTSRIAVMGGSAGGYMTLTAGFRAKPRPKALVSFWGYGDLIGDWYSKPSPHARHQRSKMTKEEAQEQVSGPVVSDSRERDGNGGAFYQYCRQVGTWPTAVSGWDPHKEAEKFYPYMALKNVTSDYPPTMLIHGTDDTDVPYENSVLMSQQFKNYGVEHRLISIENGEHGLGGGDPKEIDAAYQAAFDFVEKHLLISAPETSLTGVRKHRKNRRFFKRIGKLVSQRSKEK